MMFKNIASPIQTFIFYADIRKQFTYKHSTLIIIIIITLSEDIELFKCGNVRWFCKMHN